MKSTVANMIDEDLRDGTVTTESVYPIHNTGSNDLLACPFCGEEPELPNGDGTQYEIECPCGMAISAVQISDLMTIEERMEDDDFMVTCRYPEKYINRAKNEAIRKWNTRES
jgi:hypothetical protein